MFTIFVDANSYVSFSENVDKMNPAISKKTYYQTEWKCFKFNYLMEFIGQFRLMIGWHSSTPIVLTRILVYFFKKALITASIHIICAQ